MRSDSGAQTFLPFGPAQPPSETSVGIPQVVLGRRPSLREGFLGVDQESILMRSDSGS